MRFLSGLLAMGFIAGEPSQGPRDGPFSVRHIQQMYNLSFNVASTSQLVCPQAGAAYALIASRPDVEGRVVFYLADEGRGAFLVYDSHNRNVRLIRDEVLQGAIDHPLRRNP